MAGAAGAELGSCRNGGSRWLRLALATGDGKMAAARHPHPGTAGGGGAQWRLVRAGPRGRGAAGVYAEPLHLPQSDSCGFRARWALLPCQTRFRTTAPTPLTLTPYGVSRPPNHVLSPVVKSEPVCTPHSPKSHPAPSSQRLVTRFQPLPWAGGGKSEKAGMGPETMRRAGTLLLRWSGSGGSCLLGGLRPPATE